jgi:hypothetical protein
MEWWTRQPEEHHYVAATAAIRQRVATLAPPFYEQLLGIAKRLNGTGFNRPDRQGRAGVAPGVVT